MILRAYTLHDVKALTYSPPFFQGTDGQATRAVQDLVTDMTTTVGRHPSDFKLYCVGTYDDQTGVLQGVQPMMLICDAVSLVPKQPDLFKQAAE